MQLLIGTNNKGKVVEISESLSDIAVEILSPADLDIHKIPSETGTTFEENALQKAQFFNKKSTIPTIADDSGIHIEALKSELGIHTRRWGAGSDASDEEWITYFLNRMKSEANKTASFSCVIAYIDEQKEEHFFEGTCKGIITDTLEADYLPGLPLSACFKPIGYEKVFSALSADEKNKVSHRGKAVQLFKNYLQSTL